MPLNAGELDRRVQFQIAASTKNGLNEKVTSWADVAPARWAKVSYGSGQERREAAIEDNSLAATFQLHWASAIAAMAADTGAARIVFDGVAWDIKSIAGNRRDGLSITAVTRFDTP